LEIKTTLKASEGKMIKKIIVSNWKSFRIELAEKRLGIEGEKLKQILPLYRYYSCGDFVISSGDQISYHHYMRAEIPVLPIELFFSEKNLSLKKTQVNSNIISKKEELIKLLTKSDDLVEDILINLNEVWWRLKELKQEAKEAIIVEKQKQVEEVMLLIKDEIDVVFDDTPDGQFLPGSNPFRWLEYKESSKELAQKRLGIEG